MEVKVNVNLEAKLNIYSDCLTTYELIFEVFSIIYLTFFTGTGF